MKYEFYSENIDATLNIDSNLKATGILGLATFDNGTIQKNKGNTSITGVAYIIKCNNLSPLFKTDPLNQKNIELWLLPQTDKETIVAEVRLKDGPDMFPMGELKFIKQH